MKVKVLYREDIIKTNEIKPKPNILTREYVKQLNDGISYRIKESENNQKMTKSPSLKLTLK